MDVILFIKKHFQTIYNFKKTGKRIYIRAGSAPKYSRNWPALSFHQFVERI
ncbi:hypothetical protein HMPREF1981_01046 [Bacteroides pyogenes F0041]|uniref:Uncharacterized protein n=1 Tax=Bacteroides pyogenes F0041 TaxID=1321819 RepID=U2C6Y3_9BACE|nr:hypothetical protein HMPREF1981_01046 [Bacteroides pyogenes F0041]